MRILFVSMPESIHTARWINQILDQGWKIYLFPVYPAQPHPELRNITVFGSFLPGKRNKGNRIRFIWWTIPLFLADYVISKIRVTQTHRFTARALAFIIRWLRPGLVHSLEFQHAGYLTIAAREKFSGKFPTWMVTNWGSDLYLFGRLAEHKPKIESILSNCDYYHCECERDVELAKSMGVKGKILPVIPNTGGFDLEKIQFLRKHEPPSSRSIILLKGYQHWAGRALVGLQALRQCEEFLKGYKIAIYVASPEVRIAAELFSQDTDIPIEIIPAVSHEEMLRYYSKSRIYIGLSISDGISTSLLEAMSMGAFPIQSCTSCADEWIENGKSGVIIPPEDPHEIASAIKLALTNDALVNTAADINMKTVKEKLDSFVVKSKVVDMYQYIVKQEGNK